MTEQSEYFSTGRPLAHATVSDLVVEPARSGVASTCGLKGRPGAWPELVAQAIRARVVSTEHRGELLDRMDCEPTVLDALDAELAVASLPDRPALDAFEGAGHVSYRHFGDACGGLSAGCCGTRVLFGSDVLRR
jgi:hypothetical protein